MEPIRLTYEQARDLCPGMVLYATYTIDNKWYKPIVEYIVLERVQRYKDLETWYIKVLPNQRHDTGFSSVYTNTHRLIVCSDMNSDVHFHADKGFLAAQLRLNGYTQTKDEE